MKVVNHILYENDIQVRYIQTPNLSRGVLVPTFFTIHYDASTNGTSAINWMLNPASKVSAHLHLDRNGNIVQLAKFDSITWHAGKSQWRDYTGLNSYSIGIEIQNDGIQEYTDIQIKKCIEIAKSLKLEYDIKEIVGHSDIATPKGRKIDPGKHFPMDKVKLDAGYKVIKRATTELNMRINPTIHMAVKSVLPKGALMEVLWEDRGWAEVIYNGEKGWVSSQYIK